ncbi:MAG: hypothetical protein K9L30_03730 [Desulfobacterales bacterium]|nr:hypothetical protein [Desulfobacterales bacterium]
MTKLKKKFYWIAGTISALIIILSASLFIAEAYINSDLFQDKIKAEISKTVNGRISFQRLNLSILPRPMVSAESGKISIPDVFEGNFENLAVSPKILPLLKGSLSLDKVRLKSPDIKFVLPEINHNPEGNGPALTVEGFEKALTHMLKNLVSIAPGLEIQITSGRIKLLPKNRSPFLLKNLNINAELFPESIALDIQCGGNSWDNFTIKGRVNPEDLKGWGKIEVKGIHPKRILQYLAPDADKKIIESNLNLNISFRTDGLKSFYGDIYSSGSTIILKNGKGHLVLKGEGMKGMVNVTDDLTSFSIEEITLGNPGLSLSGKFEIGRNLLLEPLDMSAKTGLVINATDVDVNALRELTLTLIGDIEVAKTICDIVRGGQVTEFSLKSTGKTMSDLKDFSNIEITGIMENGEIFVPGVDLDLTRVSGHVVIRDSILNGENIKAAFGKTTGEKGKLKVGLMEGESPFYLDVMLDADLSPLPAILERVVKDELFLKELSLLETFTGNASGKLLLDGTTRSMTTSVDISKFSTDLKYDFLPFGIKADGGNLFFNNKGVALRNVSAEIGRSSLSIQSAKINWKPEFDLTVQTGASTFVCKEIVPWVESYYALPENIKTGTIIKSPGIKLDWNQGTHTAFSGGFETDSGVGITADVNIQGDEVTVKELYLNDDVSDAKMSFLISPDEFNMAFKGHLVKSTIEKVLSGNRFVNGHIEGDINIKVPVKEMTGFSAEGSLSGGKIQIPIKKSTPVKIKSIAISGKGNEISIRQSDISWAGIKALTHGHIRTGEGGINLDLDVSSEVVIWKKIAKYFPEKEKGSKKKNERLPITGIIRCKFDEFQFEEYVWVPAHADISFDELKTEILLKKAIICGISTPGTIIFTPEETSLDFKPAVKNLQIADTLACLLNRENTLTGTYKLDGHILSRGQSDDLIKSLSGNYELNSQDGRVYKASLISKVLSFINIREIIEINQDGFSYNTLQVKGHIENGKLILDEGILKGDSINITCNGSIDLNSSNLDLKMFVAPLSILKVIAIPVKVTGTIDRPFIIPLSPDMVGSGLINLMKKTVTLPFEIIKPVISGE